MPGPIATIGSMHICPMCSGTVPHVGGPVSGPGAPNILINGKPAALMGDMCVCVGPPDIIVQGAPSVFFNGVPVSCQGDMTAHGGVITVGEPNVIIGTATPAPSVTMPKNKIPFPKISIANRLLGNAKEAIANQEKLKEEADSNEGEPRIYNVRWIKGEQTISASHVFYEVAIKASVANIPEGESITFSVRKPVEELDDAGNEIQSEEDVIELTGTVKDKEVEVIWEVEKAENQNQSNSKESNNLKQTSGNSQSKISTTKTSEEKKIDIKFTYIKKDFTPMSLSDFKGNHQNGQFNFDIEVLNTNASSMELEIYRDNKLHYSEKIEKNAIFLNKGKHRWQWDGFDTNGILDTKKLENNSFLVKLKASADGKHIQRSVEIKSMQSDGPEWIDFVVNKNKKQIDVELRVNLKDGGEDGVKKSGSVPSSVRKKYKYPPLTSNIRPFSQLKKLALDGIAYHFSRNSSHPEGKYVVINGDKYQVTVTPKHTTTKAMDDINLVFNTNNDWKRSGNPGSVSGIISFFGNVVPERIAYNAGYIEYSNGWAYRDPSLEDIDFSYTSAHEIGHEVIKHFGGDSYSYGHKKTSSVITQSTKDNAPMHPKKGEIDVMKYYSDYIYDSELKRMVMSEKDILGLLGSVKLD